MIELTKVKTDVINYGAMKVYNTFLVISQDEVDPELFTQKQLEDIFAKKYDIIKVNIDFVVDEENEVVEHECLVFKLGKASDGTVTYMSNVNNEGSLSSLVLTKENNAVSLEVVEYSLNGDGGTKLYKHTYLEHNEETGDDITLVLLSPIAEKIDTINKLRQEYIRGNIIFARYNNEISANSGFGIIGSAIMVDLGNMVSKEDLSENLLTTDTVTPL